MQLVDSHAHLFLEEFTDDLPQVIARAKDEGVTHIFMPNIDSSTLALMRHTCEKYPGYCFPMIGLHPTSVNADYEKELEVVRHELETHRDYVAVGEIGIDLYWDNTFLQEQIIAFERQVQWAMEYNLPVVIHCREAFDYIYKVLKPYRQNAALTGIFHSFTGDEEQLMRIMEFPGFLVGVNGVITFKKSALPTVLREIPPERIVLETDAPYLTPVPNRGKRNESAYLKFTLAKVAEVYGKSVEEMAEVATENTLKVFGMLK